MSVLAKFAVSTIALDTESYGDDKTLVGFSLATKTHAEYFHILDNPEAPSLLKELRHLLADEKRVVWAHNWKGDLQTLAGAKVPVRSVIADTMIAAWLCNMHWAGKKRIGLGLKALEQYYLGIERKTFEDVIDSFLTRSQLCVKWPHLSPILQKEIAHPKDELIRQVMERYPGQYTKSVLNRRKVPALKNEFPFLHAAKRIVDSNNAAARQAMLHWGMSCVPQEHIAPYARDDARGVMKLVPIFISRLIEWGLLDTFWNLEMPVVRCLAHMEYYGVQVDETYLREIDGPLLGRCEELRKEFYKLCGFSIGSKAAADYLFSSRTWKAVKRTAKGAAWSVDKETIRYQLDTLPKTSAGYRLAAIQQEYQRVSKIHSTCVTGLLKRSRNGRVHTRFVQTGTETGRFASREPNLQNQPRPTDDLPSIRRAFVARPGWLLVGADYSQLEIAVQAHYSKDPLLLSVVTEGRSQHDITAQLLGVERHVAKTINFALQYGCGPKKLAKTLGYDLVEKKLWNGKIVETAPEEVKRLHERYYTTYAGVTAYQKAAAAWAQKNGYVRTLSGRRRYLPKIRTQGPFSSDKVYAIMKKYGYESYDKAVGLLQRLERGEAEREAANTPIQGGAADVVKSAMVRLYNDWKARGVLGTRGCILLQIHDELLCELREDFVEEGREDIRRAMQGAWELSVPLRVAPKVGRTWEDVK